MIALNVMIIMLCVLNALKLSNGLSQTPNTYNTFNMSDLLNIGKQLKRDLPPFECQESVIHFSNFLSQFIDCLLLNVYPFHICTQCCTSYNFLYDAYKDLTNKTRSKCTDSFLNGDKLLTIRDFYENSISQWTKGNCRNCYTRKDPYKFYELNNDTVTYFNTEYDYLLCLNNVSHQNETTNSTICEICRTNYNTLNDYYESILLKYNGLVCYDVVDSMKDIRSHWSLELNCPLEESGSVDVLALLLIVTLLPVTLYIAARIFCSVKYRTIMREKRIKEFYESENERTPLARN